MQNLLKNDFNRGIYAGKAEYAVGLLMNNINPKDSEEMKNLRGKKICDKIVKDAAEILEELFYE